MDKVRLVIFTKDNEVIKVSKADNFYLQNALSELIVEYNIKNCIAGYNSNEEIISKIYSLGISTSSLTIELEVGF